MKTFRDYCAQGDVYIRRVAALPAEAVETAAENGVHVIAHSETGHHHVMEAARVKRYTLPDSIMDCLLVVEEPTALTHLRAHDTHEPILFGPGVYHVRRQREYTPQGWRAAQD